MSTPIQHKKQKKRVKTSIVHMRISPALKEAAENAAQADQRSLTSLIEKLLTEHVQKAGYKQVEAA